MARAPGMLTRPGAGPVPGPGSSPETFWIYPEMALRDSLEGNLEARAVTGSCQIKPRDVKRKMQSHSTCACQQCSCNVRQLIYFGPLASKTNNGVEATRSQSHRGSGRFPSLYVCPGRRKPTRFLESVVRALGTGVPSAPRNQHASVIS